MTNIDRNHQGQGVSFEDMPLTGTRTTTADSSFSGQHVQLIPAFA